MGQPFEIRRDVLLQATPEQVWEAIATGPGLATWFMPMDLDLEGPTVTSNEPGRRLGIRLPAAEDGSFQAFDYRIEPAGPAGSRLRFSHSGFTGEGWPDDFEDITGAGWDMYLATLVRYFEHFAGLPAHYVEAEGPPSSAEGGAWSQLLAGLGLPPDGVKEGSGVRIDLPGFGAVEGVVDYVAPSFLGLRAPAALIRFHGRSALGAPLAVSMHVYVSTAFDTEGAGRAWTAWLAGVFP